MKELPKATSPEEIILTDKMEARYKKLIEIIPYEDLLIIHLKHQKDFLINIEAIKKEAIEEYKYKLYKGKFTKLKNATNTI